MAVRDRLANLAILAAAIAAWALVGIVVTTRDPRLDPGAGFIGALLIGLATGLTTVPLFWLAVFARHRRIAYRGDWFRAARRGGWVAIVIALFIGLRLQDALQLPIALFVVTMVTVAEAWLSTDD
jgi:sulfite exporter TauE/SafE